MRRLAVATLLSALLVAAPAVAATRLSASTGAGKKAAAAALKATHGGSVVRVTRNASAPAFLRFDVIVRKGAKRLDVNVAADFSVTRVGPAA
jgi:hypothetical protein